MPFYKASFSPCLLTAYANNAALGHVYGLYVVKCQFLRCEIPTHTHTAIHIQRHTHTHDLAIRMENAERAAYVIIAEESFAWVLMCICCCCPCLLPLPAASTCCLYLLYVVNRRRFSHISRWPCLWPFVYGVWLLYTVCTCCCCCCRSYFPFPLRCFTRTMDSLHVISPSPFLTPLGWRV